MNTKLIAKRAGIGSGVVLAFLVGVGAGSSSSPKTAAAPSPTVTVTAPAPAPKTVNVEKPVLSEDCQTALDAADNMRDTDLETMQFVLKAVKAMTDLDVEGMQEFNGQAYDKGKAMKTGQDLYTTAVAKCRASK